MNSGQERVERRLAAILAADVAGYSRLMEADEEGTLAALRAIRRELGDPKITEHRGRIVKATGDGMLVEFASVVDAVRYAVEMQRAMAERNTDIPPAERIEFRIGIHQGDVIVEDDDIFGDGVNLAARLEGLADPGGIYISGRLHADVAGKLDLGFEDLGEQQVKNISRPVRVFRAQFGKPRATTEPKPALALPDKPSLAVLPFQNMSGDPEQEYFADGMVEEITTAISRLPWLFVIARNSRFTYKGKAIDRVRITGQLIDAVTGNHIWADRFDGALDDIFDLQDSVAANVVGAIEPRLRLSEIERASRKATEKPRRLRPLSACAGAKLRQHRRGSCRRDRLAPAGAGDRPVLRAGRSFGCVVSLAAAGSRVGSTLRRGHCRSSWLGSAGARSGRDDPDTMWQGAFALLVLAGEPTMVEAILDRALTLNPNAAMAWQAKRWVYALRNRPEAAIEAFDRALRLSPFDPLAYYALAGLATAHLVARRFDRAVEWANRALHDQPRATTAIRMKIVANAHLGRLDEGRADLRRLLAIDPGLTIARYRAFLAPSTVPEVIDLMITGLRLAGLPEE